MCFFLLPQLQVYLSWSLINTCKATRVGILERDASLKSDKEKKVSLHFKKTNNTNIKRSNHDKLQCINRYGQNNLLWWIHLMYCKDNTTIQAIHFCPLTLKVVRASFYTARLIPTFKECNITVNQNNSDIPRVNPYDCD